MNGSPFPSVRKGRRKVIWGSRDDACERHRTGTIVFVAGASLHGAQAIGAILSAQPEPFSPRNQADLGLAFDPLAVKGRQPISCVVASHVEGRVLFPRAGRPTAVPVPPHLSWRWNSPSETK